MPCVHELASTTSGRRPASVHRQALSTIRLATCSAPRRKPFDVHGVAQQWPPTSSGIQSGNPARAETSTSARGSGGRAASPSSVCGRAEDPVDAGGEVDGRRAVAGRRAAARAPPPAASRRPTRARARGRAPRGRRGSARGAAPPRRALSTACPSARPPRAARSTRSQRFATPSATRSARSVFCRERSSLTSLPVSIPTGHESTHEPSAAQVSRPSYSNCSRSAASTVEPSGWRAISRRRTIRWRGVVVRSRLGQTGSQNPHSTQAVASASISGVVFRFRRWTPGSRLRSTPGARTPAGSASSLTRHIRRRRLLAPLALDVRGHVHPGPVLGLQRAVVLAEDQLDQLRHERLVALEVLGLREVRGQHEVQVSRRGVPGDAGQEAVLAEHRLDLDRGLGDPRRGNADVLDDQRRAGGPQLADQPVQTLADPPVDLDRLRLARERRSGDQLAPGERLDRLRLERVERRIVARRRTRPAAPPSPGRAPSTPRAPRGCCTRRRSTPARPSARRRSRRSRRDRGRRRSPRRSTGSGPTRASSWPAAARSRRSPRR